MLALVPENKIKLDLITGVRFFHWNHNKAQIDWVMIQLTAYYSNFDHIFGPVFLPNTIYIISYMFHVVKKKRQSLCLLELGYKRHSMPH